MNLIAATRAEGGLVQHEIEAFEPLITEDHSNEKSTVLKYESFHDSGLYMTQHYKSQG